MSNCPNSIANYVDTINKLVETRWIPKGITNKILSKEIKNEYLRNTINNDDLNAKQINYIPEVNKKDIAYIVSIFEGYDHIAVVRTIDPSCGLIELMISPDFLEDTRKLTEALAEEIPFRLINTQV